MWRKACLAAVLGAFIASHAEAQEVTRHVAINLASYHHKASREFNEFNPGLGFGASFALSPKVEAGAEIGWYRNSLKRGSYYVMADIDRHVARISDRVALRLGAFGGLAHYPGDADKFRDQGVPTFGNWVLAAGAQATVRLADRTDIRMRIMPAGKVADLLFTLQVTRRF